MINLSDDYFITADEYQYILARRLKKPTEKHKHTNISYHPTLGDAGRAWAKRLMRGVVQNHDMTIKEACTALYAVEQRIMEIVDRATAGK